MSKQLDIAAARIAKWRRDPVAFVRENFGVEPDEWQRDALIAFADPTIPRISMQACAGPGKSAVLAWMGWHFLATQGERGEHPNGFCTSITGENLSANLWKEFSKWQQRSAFLTAAFVWTAERIFAKDHKATWFLAARTWPKTASPDEQGKTLSGLHGKFVLVLIDESGAIPPTVMRAANQALSTGPSFGKVVQAGNPISREGMLFLAGTRWADQWHVIRITGDPDDPKRSPRINIDDAREHIRQNGRDDPWVMAYILGQFPRTAINALLSEEDVLAAMNRTLPEAEYQHAAKILGVDVAREGDDRSVIWTRQGLVSFAPISMRGASSSVGAGRIATMWREQQVDACFVDSTGGFGAGWIDRLRELGRAPLGVEFAGAPDDKRYANKRAEMWFRAAEWVKGGGCLPNVPELVGELTVPTYSFKGDAFIIEPKVNVKKRLGRSPDLADALACTFAFPAVKQPTETMVQALAAAMQIQHGGSLGYDGGPGGWEPNSDGGIPALGGL